MFPPTVKLNPAGNVNVELPPFEIPKPPLIVKFLSMARFEPLAKSTHKFPVYDVLPTVGHPVPVHVSVEKLTFPEATVAEQLHGETCA
jgi:hypothetical protein